MAEQMARALVEQVNKVNNSNLDYNARQHLIDALEAEITSLGYKVIWGVMGGTLSARIW